MQAPTKDAQDTKDPNNTKDHVVQLLSVEDARTIVRRETYRSPTESMIVCYRPSTATITEERETP